MQGLPESGKANFVLKNPRVPPPPKENLGRSWHFEFELVWRVTPAPKNAALDRSWHFGLDRYWHFGLSWSGPPLSPAPSPPPPP